MRTCKSIASLVSSVLYVLSYVRCSFVALLKWTHLPPGLDSTYRCCFSLNRRLCCYTHVRPRQFYSWSCYFKVGRTECNYILKGSGSSWICHWGVHDITLPAHNRNTWGKEPGLHLKSKAGITAWRSRHLRGSETGSGAQSAIVALGIREPWNGECTWMIPPGISRWR